MTEQIRWPFTDDAHIGIPLERLIQEMKLWAEVVCTGETRQVSLDWLFEQDVVSVIAFREHVKSHRILLDPIDPKKIPKHYLVLPTDELYEWWRNSYKVAVADSKDREADDDRYSNLVTLQQCAAIVNRSKRTLERHKKRMPKPAVFGGGRGKPDEWEWSIVRTWLQQHFGRELPERFPADRFIRG